MSLVIPDEFLQTAHISEADLRLEIAILLVQQQKINLSTASRFAGVNQRELQRILGDRNPPRHQGLANLRPELPINSPEAAQAQVTQTAILQRMEQRRTFSPAQHHLPDTLTLLQEDRAR
jgi:predicted HTH domain antitoxin